MRVGPWGAVPATKGLSLHGGLGVYQTTSAFQREVDLVVDVEAAMNDIVSLPKSLRSRIEKLSRLRKVTPESLVREVIADRVTYLEWEEKALAQGQADLDAGRVMSTVQLRKALSQQRARRGRKATKAA